MGVLDMIRYAALAGFLIIWLMYAVQAFKERTEQGVLVVFLPGYVLYYAYVRSLYGLGIRLAMAGFLTLFLVC